MQIKDWWRPDSINAQYGDRYLPVELETALPHIAEIKQHRSRQLALDRKGIMIGIRGPKRRIESLNCMQTVQLSSMFERKRIPPRAPGVRERPVAYRIHVSVEVDRLARRERPLIRRVGDGGTVRRIVENAKAGSNSQLLFAHDPPAKSR